MYLKRKITKILLLLFSKKKIQVLYLYFYIQAQLSPNCFIKNYLFMLLAGKWASARFCLAYLAFSGLANIYAQRIALSVAILSMVNSTNQVQESSATSNSSCAQIEVDTSSQEVSLLKAYVEMKICNR